MKVPTRPAPPPPGKGLHSSYSIFNQKETIIGKVCQPKKKPPPRPPPPKFCQQRTSDSKSSLVSGLFRPQSRPIYEPVAALSAGSCLIDWTSPPSSPTSTTRSSSDALSVNSFGSDSVTHSSGSTSNVESGFEDDFDLFGSSTSRLSDPWSPQPVAKPVSKPTWEKFSPNTAKKLIMPTIIRAKPERPKPPKILEKKMEMDALAEVFSHSYISKTTSNYQEDADDWNSDSPPMPTCPPPPPPSELLTEYFSSSDVGTSKFHGRNCDDWNPLLDSTLQHPQSISESRSSLPTMENNEMYRRPDSRSAQQQVAKALFDYNGVDGDLSFRRGDSLLLVSRIDDNWFQAELNGHQGTVPANFLQIENGDPLMVSALYQFNPETWEDLALQPGSRVKLLGRVNADWLYGEVDGRRGQFPATFVDHVPDNLQKWTQ